MSRLLAPIAALLLLAVAPSAFARSYRCVFTAVAPQVVQIVTPTDATHVSVQYSGGQTIPYRNTGSADVLHWISNHHVPVTYDFQIASGVLRAGVPVNNGAGLATDAVPNIRAIVPGSGPQDLNVLRVVRVATCSVLP